MGRRFHRGVYSDKLEKLADMANHDEYADWAFDSFDLTSTAGHDNDGSTGPEMVDIGVGLGFACRDAAWLKTKGYALNKSGAWFDVAGAERVRKAHSGRGESPCG